MIFLVQQKRHDAAFFFSHTSHSASFSKKGCPMPFDLIAPEKTLGGRKERQSQSFLKIFVIPLTRAQTQIVLEVLEQILCLA